MFTIERIDDKTKAQAVVFYLSPERFVLQMGPNDSSRRSLKRKDCESRISLNRWKK